MAITSAWIARGVFRLNYLQMDMDEAVHANRGLDFTSSVQRNDWQDLWGDFIKPHWYPPGNGILLGSWFLFAGASLETARLYSTLFYFLFGILLWFSIRELIPSANPFLYLIPPLLLLSDAQHAVYAALSMLELPAITLAFAALLFLNRAWRNKSLIDHTLAFFFGLLCLFTKYNYGLVVLVVFAICYAAMFWQRVRSRQTSRDVRYMLMNWIVYSLIIGIWFLGLGEWRWLFDYANAQPDRYSIWELANLLYYPRLVWNNPIAMLAVLLSIAGWIQLSKQRRYLLGLTPYLLFFSISLVMLTVELQNSPRFGMILFPSLWITAGVGAHLLVADLNQQWLRKASYLGFLCVLILASAGNFRLFMSRLFAEHENANPGVNQAYNFVSTVLDIPTKNGSALVMIGRTDQWNGPALRFHLVSQCLLVERGCEIDVRDTWELRKGWPTQELPEEVQRQRLDTALEQADYLVNFFDHPESPAGWELISERQFTFERLHKKPAIIWVSIYKHGSSASP